jgi:hypothetical protein
MNKNTMLRSTIRIAAVAVVALAATFATTTQASAHDSHRRSHERHFDRVRLVAPVPVRIVRPFVRPVVVRPVPVVRRPFVYAPARVYVPAPVALGRVVYDRFDDRPAVRLVISAPRFGVALGF